jgi:hypothetical protein
VYISRHGVTVAMQQALAEAQAANDAARVAAGKSVRPKHQ